MKQIGVKMMGGRGGGVEFKIYIKCFQIFPRTYMFLVLTVRQEQPTNSMVFQYFSDNLFTYQNTSTK